MDAIRDDAPPTLSGETFWASGMNDAEIETAIVRAVDGLREFGMTPEDMDHYYAVLHPDDFVFLDKRAHARAIRLLTDKSGAVPKGSVYCLDSRFIPDERLTKAEQPDAGDEEELHRP